MKLFVIVLAVLWLQGCSNSALLSQWTYSPQVMQVPACVEGVAWMAPCVGYSNGKKIAPTLNGIEGPGWFPALIIVDGEGTIRAQEVKVRRP